MPNQLSNFGRTFSRWLPGIAATASRGILTGARQREQDEKQQQKLILAEDIQFDKQLTASRKQEAKVVEESASRQALDDLLRPTPTATVTTTQVPGSDIKPTVSGRITQPPSEIESLRELTPTDKGILSRFESKEKELKKAQKLTKTVKSGQVITTDAQGNRVKVEDLPRELQSSKIVYKDDEPTGIRVFEDGTRVSSGIPNLSFEKEKQGKISQATIASFNREATKMVAKDGRIKTIQAEVENNPFYQRAVAETREETIGLAPEEAHEIVMQQLFDNDEEGAVYKGIKRDIDEVNKGRRDLAESKDAVIDNILLSTDNPDAFRFILEDKGAIERARTNPHKVATALLKKLGKDATADDLKLVMPFIMAYLGIDVRNAKDILDLRQSIENEVNNAR